MNTTSAVLIGIFLMLGLLFGLACFFLGPAGWLFWVLFGGPQVRPPSVDVLICMRLPFPASSHWT